MCSEANAENGNALNFKALILRGMLNESHSHVCDMFFNIFYAV